MPHWHIFTPEYPPDLGGVAGYTKQVAEGLIEAGDQVIVWAPSTRTKQLEGEPHYVRRDLAGWSIASLCRVWRALERYEAPRHLLVQWVPHGYGWNSMNVPFCLWIFLRACRGDRVELMIHEAFLSFNRRQFRQNVVAVVHRLMMVALLGATKQAWTAIPAWGKAVKKYQLGRKIRVEWLPVPSNVPVSADREQVDRLRDSLSRGSKTIIGHFGTYSSHHQESLSRVLACILDADPNRVLLLLGRNGEEFCQRFLRRNPSFSERVAAKGILPDRQLSIHLAACDLVVQPYPDGASSRRTTLMAALEHGVPVVTTYGTSTEEFWLKSGAVALAPAEEPESVASAVEQVIRDVDRRTALRERGRSVYYEMFDVGKTVARLREHQLGFVRN